MGLYGLYGPLWGSMGGSMGLKTLYARKLLLIC